VAAARIATEPTFFCSVPMRKRRRERGRCIWNHANACYHLYCQSIYKKQAIIIGDLSANGKLLTNFTKIGI
jgi:hypothetical protein